MVPGSGHKVVVIIVVVFGIWCGEVILEVVAVLVMEVFAVMVIVTIVLAGIGVEVKLVIIRKVVIRGVVNIMAVDGYKHGPDGY